MSILRFAEGVAGCMCGLSLVVCVEGVGGCPWFDVDIVCACASV